MSKIIQKGNDVLRQKAREVKKEEISSEYLKKTLKKMREALEEEKDGFAVAAPQVGESIRVFLISERLFQYLKGTQEPQLEKIYINPKILKSSKETELMEEGCLSVRNWYGKVRRCKKVKIEAFDENGKKFQEGASGILAQVFQHEIDHLNGVLFTDMATDLKEVDSSNLKE